MSKQYRIALHDRFHRAEAGAWHAVLDVSRFGTRFVTVCAESWCDGTCGFPALVSSDGTQKAHGPMVAVGRVMQPWRVEWRGETVRLEADDMPEMEDRCWW